MDGRVHELEALLGQATARADGAEQNTRDSEAAAAARSKSLEEMLGWERERYGKLEKEAKGQKKLLVREVKSLRGQVVQLAADRDAYKRQANALMAQRQKAKT